MGIMLEWGKHAPGECRFYVLFGFCGAQEPEQKASFLSSSRPVVKYPDLPKPA